MNVSQISIFFLKRGILQLTNYTQLWKVDSELKNIVII